MVCGLVILKHKSWHVYNEKNREKVRKDEEKAQKELDEKKQRSVKADQEYRLEVLRSKSSTRKRKDTEVDDSADHDPKDFVSAGKEGVHLNLFGDLESKKGDGKNTEHEAEKAAEKQKFEKQFTMYLGQEVGKDGAPVIPWYAKESSSVQDKLGIKRVKTEQFEDPAAKFISNPTHEDNQIDSNPSKKKDHKRKKEKKESKKHHRHHTTSPPPISKGKSIEELRAERLAREKRERVRVQEEIFLPSSAVVSDRDRSYNSAFNPEFVRNKRR
ncbi:hypothetical protein BDR26DRAFT_1004097 [Obelidium mucronatum]|nr:hypothetical protein BDR26DRAFT_1004097 [Obelidium mucronatum]